jgi:hypothetical protein
VSPVLNCDGPDVSESLLQASVDFSDCESDFESSFGADEDAGRAKKDSFISEVEFRPKSEVSLEILGDSNGSKLENGQAGGQVENKKVRSRD